MSKRVAKLVSVVGLALMVSGCAVGIESPLRGDHSVASSPSDAVGPEEEVLGTAHMEIDGPSYSSWEELAAASVAVVSVEIQGSESGLEYPNFDSDDPLINPYAGTGRTPSPQEIEDMALPVTLTRAKISAVMAGDLYAGDEIVILELGGLVNGIKYEVTDVESLREGQLLFLIATPDGRYQTAGDGQGRFNPDGIGGFVSSASPEIRITAAEMATLTEY